MDEFWEGLSTTTLQGSGHLSCRHATQWQCDTRIAQLQNGRIGVRVSGLKTKPADADRWIRHCEPFSVEGALKDGRHLTIEGIHFSRTVLSRLSHEADCVLEGFVGLPGFVEVSVPEWQGVLSLSIICEVTNVFLDHIAGPIETDDGKARIQLQPLSGYHDSRRLMEALRTCGIMSCISIEFLKQTQTEYVDRLVHTLCLLLTLAQRSPVSCVARHWLDDKRRVVRSRYQEPTFAYPTVFRPLVPAGLLADYFRQTLTNIESQGQTWDLGHALDYYVQAISLNSAWPQGVGFFTALETLKNAYLQRRADAEFGNYVPKSQFQKSRVANKVIDLLADSFKTFRSLSSDERESLRGKVGELNRRAYKLVLQEMFRELDVTVDVDALRQLVSLRNQLIHRGSPDYGKPPWRSPSEAFSRVAILASLVETTFLAILSYRGDFERYDQTVKP